MEFLKRYSWENVFEMCVSGINGSIPGNGGPECCKYLSNERIWIETIIGSLVGALYVYWGYVNATLPPEYKTIRKDRGGRRVLLAVFSLVLGMEIGFKLATKSFIYILNPCHITCAIQIYLLGAPPSKFVTGVFRIHLNFMNGAILAILFPVTNARMLPFELEVYWIQHIMMLITPYYMLRLGGVYTVEDLKDFSWTIMSLGILLLYHFLPLQWLSMVAEVNLNNMACPAISDPFYGPNYRIFAVVHQTLCVPIVCKSFCLISNFFITKFPPTKVKDTLEADVTMSTETERSEHQVTFEQNGLESRTLDQLLHRRTRSEAEDISHRNSTVGYRHKDT